MSESGAIYDDIEIEDMMFLPDLQVFRFPCPCGDQFEISLLDLHDGEDIAVCPSCSLQIRVIFEKEVLPPLPSSKPAPNASL